MILPIPSPCDAPDRGGPPQGRVGKQRKIQVLQNVPVSDPLISQNIEAGEQKIAWFCGFAHGLSKTSLFAFIRCVVVEKKIIARVMVVRVFFGALHLT